MHTDRFAQRVQFRSQRAFSRPLQGLETNNRRDERFKHRPKTKLQLAAPATVPDPALIVVLEETPRDASPNPQPYFWTDDSFSEEEGISTYVDVGEGLGPSRMPRELIWEVVTDAVHDMPKETPAIKKYNRVAHVYCGLDLGVPGRHATLRYVHKHMMERLARIWRRRQHIRYEGLVYLASAIMRDLERKIMDIFECGRDMMDGRPRGRRIRQCRMATGRRKNCFFTYEPHGEDNVPYILTLQDGRCHDRQLHRSRLQPRCRVRRPKDRGRQRQQYF